MGEEGKREGDVGYEVWREGGLGGGSRGRRNLELSELNWIRSGGSRRRGGLVEGCSSDEVEGLNSVACGMVETSNRRVSFCFWPWPIGHEDWTRTKVLSSVTNTYSMLSLDSQRFVDDDARLRVGLFMLFTTREGNMIVSVCTTSDQAHTWTLPDLNASRGCW